MSERRLKVSSLNQQRADRCAETRSVASIRLSGKWLEELGFKIGNRFVVRESPGRIELVADWVDQCGLLKGQTHGTHS